MYVFMTAAGERVGGHQDDHFLLNVVKRPNSKRCFSVSRVAVLAFQRRNQPC